MSIWERERITGVFLDVSPISSQSWRCLHPARHANCLGARVADRRKIYVGLKVCHCRSASAGRFRLCHTFTFTFLAARLQSGKLRGKGKEKFTAKRATSKRLLRTQNQLTSLLSLLLCRLEKCSISVKNNMHWICVTHAEAHTLHIVLF